MAAELGISYQYSAATVFGTLQLQSSLGKDALGGEAEFRPYKAFNQSSCFLRGLQIGAQSWLGRETSGIVKVSFRLFLLLA